MVITNTTVMSQFNEDTEPLEQTMTLEDFYQAASVSQQILNLISLGSVLQADTRGTQDGKNDSREEDVTRPSEPSSRRKLSDGKGSNNPVRKLSEERPKGKATGGEPGIPRRPEAAVGRGSPRGNKPVTEEHAVDERRRISEDKGPERGEKRRSGQNNEVKNITKEKDTRNAEHNRSEEGEEEREDIIEEDEHAVEEEESEEETLEEMNARLVAHVRALQRELRKYMQFDVQNKQEIEKLKNHSMTLQEQNRKIAKKLEKITRQEKQEQKGMRFVLSRVHAFREKRADKGDKYP